VHQRQALTSLSVESESANTEIAENTWVRPALVFVLNVQTAKVVNQLCAFAGAGAPA
jgi:hypothetical protein